ncbi:MAG: c-type cytochrome [Sphingomonadales bacterium]
MKLFKQILKWGGLTILALVLGIFGYSEYLIKSGPDPVPVTLTLPTDAISLAEGERLAQTRGCTGCHSKDIAGQIFFDEPIFARVVTPNLTGFFQTESVETLEAAIRQGIGADGRPLVLMPSDMFSYLSDEDTAKIIAYLKTMPEVENDLPDNFFGPISRLIFISGDFKTAPNMILQNPAFKFNQTFNPNLFKGEYIAMTVCTECHGQNLAGENQDEFAPPDLSIVAGYTPEAFAHLMKTGEASGGRELGLMAFVAKDRFSHLRDDEVEALYAFLVDRAEKGNTE